jgi:hypothetical protein
VPEQDICEQFQDELAEKFENDFENNFHAGKPDK